MTWRIDIGILLAVSCMASAEPHPSPPEPAPLARGRQIAVAVATVTGTAMSPLFGVCALGAYTYLKTPPADRALLPFYCSPAFWIPLAVLVALVLLKDTVGSAAPILKKPLDAIEVLIVNKAALLFAVLPIVWHQAAGIADWYHPAAPLTSGILPAVHGAAPGALLATAGAIPMILAVVSGTVVAIAVWLTGHALDVVGLLSPVPLLDLLFKAFRVAIFLTIGALMAFNLRAALVVSLIIVAICLMCVWWAFRLAVFGAVFAWDIVSASLLGRERDPSHDSEILGFTAYAMGGLGKRSFGALRIAADGSLEFSHRPIGIGFRRAVRLRSPGEYQVGRSLFFPCVITSGSAGTNYRFQFRLLPRYAGFEQQVNDVLRLGGVRDLRVPSELRGAWDWLHGTVAKARAW